jgi:hypothetical protein
MAYYYAPAAAIYLLDDAASQWLSAPLSGGGTLQNSQCVIALDATTVSIGGSTLTLTMAVTFTPTFAGVKSVMMYATNAAGIDTGGWEPRGTWNVP